MTTNAYGILKFESMIKKGIVTNHAVFAVAFLGLHQFYRTAEFISNLQKDFPLDNLSIVCLRFYMHNSLKILEDNISCHIKVKNQ